MTLDGLIRMVINTVIRRLIHLGVNRGIDLVAGKGKPKAKMSAAERKQGQDARATAKRARQAAKLTRRLGR